MRPTYGLELVENAMDIALLNFGSGCSCATNDEQGCGEHDLLEELHGFDSKRLDGRAL